MDWPVFAARWAIASVVVLILVKSYVYWVSGSIAILGSLIDSLADGLVSVMMLAAIMYAAKPADEDHRYGHGKIEGIAALFQGALLCGAGVFLLLESLRGLIVTHEIYEPLLGVGVSVLAIVLSLGVVSVQNYALRRSSSLAVEADQSHYKSDLALNAGVIVGLLVNYFGGPVWVDAMIGVLISLYIFKTAYTVGMKAADMLMDKELPEENRQQIEAIINAHSDVHGLHDLRTRDAGQIVHISFDIEVDPDISLREAHDITRDLERKILEKFPNADIIIHTDPKGDIFDARHRVQGIHH